MLFVLVGILLGIDQFLGYGLHASLKRSFNPFYVSVIAELVLFLILLFFLLSGLLFFKKNKKEGNKDKKQQPQS